MAPQRICILGCGVMGTALVKGWLKASSQEAPSFNLYTKRSSSETTLKQTFTSDNVKTFSGDSLLDSIEGCDVVLLGFMPGDAAKVLGNDELQQALKGKLIISMLAGVATSALKSHLGADAPEVVRLIPTIAADVGKSATMVATSDSGPSEGALSITGKLFSMVGSVLKVPEELMNEATAISAAVHALAIVAIDSATDAGVCNGFPRSTASDLVVQALNSAVGLMLEAQMQPADVKTAMSTPGGITINAISKLDASVRGGIADAVGAAVEHVKKMG